MRESYEELGCDNLHLCMGTLNHRGNKTLPVSKDHLRIERIYLGYGEQVV